jgi:PPM family protein phosphatase
MKRIARAHLPVVALTHPGMRGKNNEDRFAVSAFRLEDSRRSPVLLAMLCDGIGGHHAGEVAAEIAVNRISQIIAQSDGRRPTYIIQAAVTQVSQEIHARAQADASQLGMGATFACAWVIGSRLFTGTVGDTRVYLLRGGEIQQISTDHTWVQEALEHGLIGPEQVRNHPNAHVIRRYLGSENPPSVDFRLRLSDEEDDIAAETNQGTPLQPGDILLLCSDGLSDLVEADEILDVFRQQPGNRLNAGQKLIDLANSRGGHDNITLIAIQVPVSATLPVKTMKVSQPVGIHRRWLVIGCSGLFALGALVGSLATGWLWYSTRPVAGNTPAPLVWPKLFFRSSATAFVREVTSSPSPVLTLTNLQLSPSETRRVLPVDNGPTLTPWPTATPRPTSTATLTPVITPSETPAMQVEIAVNMGKAPISSWR